MGLSSVGDFFPLRTESPEPVSGVLSVLLESSPSVVWRRDRKSLREESSRKARSDWDMNLDSAHGRKRAKAVPELKLVDLGDWVSVEAQALRWEGRGEESKANTVLPSLAV